MNKILESIRSIDKLPKRTAMTLFGVIICAISVGIFKIAALGVDPFQSFMAGLDALVPIDFGTLYVIANAVLLLFVRIFALARLVQRPVGEGAGRDLLITVVGFPCGDEVHRLKRFDAVGLAHAPGGGFVFGRVLHLSCPHDVDLPELPVEALFPDGARGDLRLQHPAVLEDFRFHLDLGIPFHIAAHSRLDELIEDRAQRVDDDLIKVPSQVGIGKKDLQRAVVPEFPVLFPDGGKLYITNISFNECDGEIDNLSLYGYYLYN